ncbi:MAG: hypothetical protein HOV81_31665 [Kofleriaceae bacterium]|nr:hypothetical protein [Kofleriaceae bacterium]
MIRALALAAILVAPASAYASHTCGGGGGGGSSGSSSSSSSSSSNSGSSWSHTPTSSGTSGSTECVEDNDVVGYRQCTKFGAWGTNLRLPRLFIELGTNVRQFGSRLGSHAGTVSHGAESFSYRMVMPETGGLDTAVTSAMRLGIGLPHGLYAGAEAELGGISAQGGTVEMQAPGAFGTPQLDASTGMYIGLLGIAGLRGTAGRATFGLEAAGGVRTERYRFASTYHNCETTSVIGVSEAVVEARARAELWLNPWITAGVSLGTSVVERNDWLAGAYFGFHTRAFAGGR